MSDVRQGAERFGAAHLTPRERWNRCMHYQQVDYVSHIEFGYWDELKEDWVNQGHLPLSFRQEDGHIPDRLVEEYFGCEQFEGYSPRIGALPLRPQQVLEQTEDTIVFRDGHGVLRQSQYGRIKTIPHFLEFPIRDRATWHAFRAEFLDVNHPAHQLAPEELAAGEYMSRTTSNPVSVYFGSFIGWVRDWIGFENLALLSVDDPGLIEEIVRHLSDMLLALLPPVLERGQFDAAAGWEDICYNSGPILSPRFFAERIMPNMAPVMRLLRQHGIDVIWTDCDGNILKLIPLWMNVGLNCMFPLEVRPGNDPVALKREYGRDLLIRGGFNKDVLHEDRAAVIAELKRLEPAVAQGGFVPGVDHRVPADVTWDMYCYYIWEKCHMLGWPEERVKSFPALRAWRP